MVVSNTRLPRPFSCDVRSRAGGLRIHKAAPIPLIVLPEQVYHALLLPYRPCFYVTICMRTYCAKQSMEKVIVFLTQYHIIGSIFTVTGVVLLVCVCSGGGGGRGGRGTGAAAYISTALHLTRHIHLNMPPNYICLLQIISYPNYR